MKVMYFIFLAIVFSQMILVIILASKTIVDVVEYIGEYIGLWAALNRIDNERIANERKLGWRD